MSATGVSVGRTCRMMRNHILPQLNEILKQCRKINAIRCFVKLPSRLRGAPDALEAGGVENPQHVVVVAGHDARPAGPVPEDLDAVGDAVVAGGHPAPAHLEECQKGRKSSEGLLPMQASTFTQWVG